MYCTNGTVYCSKGLLSPQSKCINFFHTFCIPVSNTNLIFSSIEMYIYHANRLNNIYQSIFVLKLIIYLSLSFSVPPSLSFFHSSFLYMYINKFKIMPNLLCLAVWYEPPSQNRRLKSSLYNAFRNCLFNKSFRLQGFIFESQTFCELHSFKISNVCEKWRSESN